MHTGGRKGGNYDSTVKPALTTTSKQRLPVNNDQYNSSTASLSLTEPNLFPCAVGHSELPDGVDVGCDATSVQQQLLSVVDRQKFGFLKNMFRNNMMIVINMIF
jgi:hypothetical protein